MKHKSDDYKISGDGLIDTKLLKIFQERIELLSHTR